MILKCFFPYIQTGKYLWYVNIAESFQPKKLLVAQESITTNFQNVSDWKVTPQDLTVSLQNRGNLPTSKIEEKVQKFNVEWESYSEEKSTTLHIKRLPKQ